MRNTNRLTSLQVTRAKRPGRYADGGGLYLRVADGGSKSWVLRYMCVGRERFMGLGAIADVTLAEAREKARQQRKLIRDGLDPIEHKRSKRFEHARRVTFRHAAERFIAAKESGWKSEKHQAQWHATLASYAYPVIGDMAVADITTADVLRVIEPHWSARRETAKRARGRIEQVIEACIARGEVKQSNPADWKRFRHLVAGGRKTVRHHPALPYSELPTFMDELRQHRGVSALALEFLILTAARTSEVIGAKRPEFDLAAKVWTVPEERMKGGRTHRVPLVPRALEILAGLPGTSDGFMFLSPRGGPLSGAAMLELMRDVKPGYVPHGFRSTFRDWAAETTAYPNHVVEAALAHAISDKVEAAYRRGDLFEKRARLMRDWARYCAETPTARAGGNVTALRIS